MNSLKILGNCIGAICPKTGQKLVEKGVARNQAKVINVASEFKDLAEMSMVNFEGLKTDIFCLAKENGAKIKIKPHRNYESIQKEYKMNMFDTTATNVKKNGKQILDPYIDSNTAHGVFVLDPDSRAQTFNQQILSHLNLVLETLKSRRG